MRNQLGYVCVPPSLLGGFSITDPDPFEVELADYQLPQTRTTGTEFVPAELPGNPAGLLRGNIAQHFERCATDLHGGNYHAADLFSRVELPPIPEVFHNTPGWTRYQFTGGRWRAEPVDYPLEEVFVFDTETFVTGSPFAMPIIATALSQNSVYVWLSPQLLAGIFDGPTAPLPLVGPNKLLIAHNAAYDLARVQERYALGNPHGVYGLDTMSLVQITSGLDSTQRWAWNLQDRQNVPRWVQHGTPKGLIDSWNHWVGRRVGVIRSQEEKSIRDVFVKSTNLVEIRDQLPQLLTYAVGDVVLTAQLFQAVWPAFQSTCPSRVVFAAHMELSTTVLPVAADWFDWIDRCDAAVAELQTQEQLSLVKLAQQALEAGPNDPWLAQLDWSLTRSGEPSWYKKCKGGYSLTSKSDVTHYLLKLAWNGQPLRKVKNKGWCYGDPPERLPHKNPGENVGCVLTDFYETYFEQGVLTSAAGELARELIHARIQTSYWVGIRDRVRSRSVRPVLNPLNGKSCLVLAPEVVPANTTTLRTGESLFLTLASHTKPKIGAEIKMLTRAPAGWKIVSFDFDSQELQILAAYADSYLGVSGCTPFSQSVLVGDKKTKSDTHSLVAKAAGISRDAAKQAVYAICYGAGARTVATGICSWHPEYDSATAERFARDTISAFKGRKTTSGRFSGGQASAAFNKMHDLLAQFRPSTPLLGTAMAPALWPANNGEFGAPSQLNWQVQSAGSSMLHCAIVGILWLARHHGIDAHLAITVHDELVFYVPARQAKRFAYWVQIGHAWCWYLLHYKLGIGDLPAIRAWASGVTIGKTWRKNPKNPGVTPTFPGLSPDREYTMRDLV